MSGPSLTQVLEHLDMLPSLAKVCLTEPTFPSRHKRLVFDRIGCTAWSKQISRRRPVQSWCRGRPKKLNQSWRGWPALEYLWMDGGSIKNEKCLRHMNTSAPNFLKLYFFEFYTNLKYPHKYKHFEGTVRILEKNILYFELCKKTNFL
jgi:hypothetical protein